MTSLILLSDAIETLKLQLKRANAKLHRLLTTEDYTFKKVHAVRFEIKMLKAKLYRFEKTYANKFHTDVF